jgi:hypothetical protein
MAKKKKKMTKAQAAAARRDDRPRRATVVAPPKDEGPKNKDNRLFAVIIPLVSIALIIVLSLVFTVGPGLMIGR